MKVDFQSPRHYSANLILDACLEALFKRFSSLLHLECEEALIAAVPCPKFKLRWFNTLKSKLQSQTGISRDSVKQTFISCAERLLDSENVDNDNGSNDSNEHDAENEYDVFFILSKSKHQNLRNLRK
ncbi:unnamed protein product [Psylliodes chrysocephalus]|uniref:Uncharacterized protein n=1 Tax=Psylliodes chrysocephalus TaxID=3402493 RepID=A0A9P0CWK3_9CUCU|nr:unnamed protein product [Psylliodes chrysocephala]